MTVLVLYVDGSVGADTNSGSTEGTASSSGTAATRASAVYTLDGSPDLSGVVDNQDTIHIVGETSGRGNDGTIFEITAHDDGADTVTVSPTPSGGTSGLTWAIGGAFVTIDKYYQVAEAGDLGGVKASATYTEEATARTAGTDPLPITVEGYTTTLGDNGVATIDGSSANPYGFDNDGTAAFQIIKNMKVINMTSVGFSSNNSDNCMCYNCHADNGGAAGFFGDNNNKYINCSGTNCVTGFDLDATNLYFGCVAHGNSGQAFVATSGSIAINCRASALGSGSIGFFNMSGVFNCTIDGEGGATTIGVQIVAGGGAAYGVINNIIYDCNFGVFSTSESLLIPAGFNLINSNATGDYFLLAENLGGNDVTGAPQFTNEAGDDYTLAAGSPALDAGIDAGDAPA